MLVFIIKTATQNTENTNCAKPPRFEAPTSLGCPGRESCCDIEGHNCGDQVEQEENHLDIRSFWFWCWRGCQATEATDFKRINYMIPARSDGTSWYSLRGEEVANEVTLIFRNDSLHCTSMDFLFLFISIT